jgi:hypothetical protein
MRNIQELAKNYLDHKISKENFIFYLFKEILLNSDKHGFLTRIAQSLYFISPEPGDGE